MKQSTSLAEQIQNVKEVWNEADETQKKIYKSLGQAMVDLIANPDECGKALTRHFGRLAMIMGEMLSKD